MSNIVASSFTADLQTDGRHQVHEIHTDLAGQAHTLDYLAASDEDLSAALAVHAQVLGDQLRDREIAANRMAISRAGRAATVTNVYSSVAENVAAAKAAFPAMSIGDSLMMADFMTAQSDVVLEQLYGLTAQQVADLRALPTLAQQAAALQPIAGA